MICSACDGTGITTYEIPGGKFDTHAEQWYPRWGSYTCETCGGTGRTEEEVTE